MPTVMQWVKHLLEKIDTQAAYAAPFEKRYNNEFILPFIAAEYREVYGTRVDSMLTAINPPRTGVAGITVDALTDRLTIAGATSDNADAARVVEQAWEDNDLDVMYREAHREALIKSRAFGQLDVAADGEHAVVGIEAAEQMAVHRMPHPPYDVDAALKVSVDEWTGKRRGRLFLREEHALGVKVRKIDVTEGTTAQPDPEGSAVMSRWVAGPESEWRLPWVPVVEFPSKPRLLAEPVSEIDHIASLVDIADLVEGLMVFAGHFGAVPIRWAKGLDVMRDPKNPSKPLLGPDGKPMIGFNPRADHMWVSTSKDAAFGQLEPAGLASFVTWAEHVSSRIRAKTQVASTYYSMDLKSHMSAELLKTDEAPMVRRVNGMGRDGAFNQAWRRLNRMILAIERPDLAGARVPPRWASAETRIESQDADRFSKLVSHLSPRLLAEDVLGWSPERAKQAVDEAEAMKVRMQNTDLDPYLIAGALDAGMASPAPVG